MCSWLIFWVSLFLGTVGSFVAPLLFHLTKMFNLYYSDGCHCLYLEVYGSTLSAGLWFAILAVLPVFTGKGILGGWNSGRLKPMLPPPASSQSLSMALGYHSTEGHAAFHQVHGLRSLSCSVDVGLGHVQCALTSAVLVKPWSGKSQSNFTFEAF